MIVACKIIALILVIEPGNIISSVSSTWHPELLGNCLSDNILFGRDGKSVPSEIGPSNSIGESENAEPTLDPEEEDFGAGLQDEDDDDIVL